MDLGAPGLRARRLLVGLSLVVSSCLWGGSAGKDAGDVFYTPQDRVQALQEAQLVSDGDPGARDILAGPDAPPGLLPLPFDARVECDFKKAGAEKSGHTPKFDCEIRRVEDPATGAVFETAAGQRGEKVKVKYGADNGEVYAEVAATRLFWALGFPVDAMYPVRVSCRDCPEDPYRGTGPRGQREFSHAVIERKLEDMMPASRMYEARAGKGEGWSWCELERDSRAPLAQRDALRLLAAFVVHGDNKPSQQRLLCTGVEVDRATTPWHTTCGTSLMYVQDLGATFGGGGWFTSNRTAKMNLDSWAAAPVWRKVGTPTHPDGSSDVECQAYLPNALSARGGLHNPRISEEGRRYLADRLRRLSRPQIVALFRAAQVDRAPRDRWPAGAATGEEVTERWVETFLDRRREILEGSCRWKESPPRVSEVER